VACVVAVKPRVHGSLSFHGVGLESRLVCQWPESPGGVPGTN